MRTAAAGLRSRIKRQGGDGQAFFCLDGTSLTASGGEGDMSARKQEIPGQAGNDECADVPRGRGSPIRSGMTCEWDATRQGIPDQVGDDKGRDGRSGRP